MNESVYVAYYRVSTDRQGKSGLGLEAQEIAVQQYLKGFNGRLIGQYTEIETGRRSDRPELAAALELCRRSRAKLVIAKLDRLARNVAFVSALIEGGTRFIAVDMPEADVTFLQMAAVFGEWEARKISERTKAALAAAKARGIPLGWAIPSRRMQQPQASAMGSQAVHVAANRFAADMLPLVTGIRAAGVRSYEGIAKALNARGVKTRRGGTWHASTVRNLELRYGAT